MPGRLCGQRRIALPERFQWGWWFRETSTGIQIPFGRRPRELARKTGSATYSLSIMNTLVLEHRGIISSSKVHRWVLDQEFFALHIPDSSRVRRR